MIACDPDRSDQGIASDVITLSPDIVIPGSIGPTCAGAFGSAVGAGDPPTIVGSGPISGSGPVVVTVVVAVEVVTVVEAGAAGVVLPVVSFVLSLAQPARKATASPSRLDVTFDRMVPIRPT